MCVQRTVNDNVHISVYHQAPKQIIRAILIKLNGRKRIVGNLKKSWSFER